jgi:dynein heavy chain, axonemal
LELFDDNSGDDFTNEDWVGRRVDENGKARKLYAKVLIKDQGFYSWRHLEIFTYDA